MLLGNLKCCKITKIEKDIAELACTEGMELTAGDIDDIHSILEDQMVNPYMIIVDKRIPHSYTEKAQVKLGEAPSMKAVAIISHDAIAAAMQRYLHKMQPDKPMNLEVFDSKEGALKWLTTQR